MTNNQPTNKEARIQQMQVTYTELSEVTQALKAEREPVTLFNKSIRDDDSLDHSITATLFPVTDQEQDIYPRIEITYTTPEHEETRTYGIRQRDLQEIARDIRTWVAQEITPYI